MLNGFQVKKYAETILQEDIEEDDAFILGLIWDALNDISARAPYKDITTINTVMGQPLLSLPDRFRGVEYLSNGTSEIKYSNMRGLDLATTGTPNKYFFLNSYNKIGLNPVPDKVYNLGLVYWRGYMMPQELNQKLDALNPVDGGGFDSSGCLPPEYHNAVSYFVAGTMCDHDDTGMLNRLWGEYNKKVAKLALEQTYDFDEYPGTIDVLPKTRHRGDR
jgi:hypothetical protein